MSIEQLIRHPKTFLKDNAVWVSGRMNVTGRGKAELWPVQLARMGGVTCSKRDGTAMPCWEIIPATDLRNHVLAYFLPWAPNSTKTMTLGTKASLFLTDTLNGCTFAGVGGTSPTVAHVNYNMGKVEGNPIDQVFMDGEVTKLFPGGARVLRKGDYNTPIFPNCTVIGVLRGGGWDFVYQSRNYVNSTATKNYEYMSVHTIR